MFLNFFAQKKRTDYKNGSIFGPQTQKMKPIIDPRQGLRVELGHVANAQVNGFGVEEKLMRHVLK
jgi:hypothetical protein